VDLGDTVDHVRAHDGQMSHANHLHSALLDDRHAAQAVVVSGEAALDGLEEEQVDIKDDLHVAVFGDFLFLF